MLYSTLATLHNLRHYLDIMRRLRGYFTWGLPEFLKTARSFASDPDSTLIG